MEHITKPSVTRLARRAGVKSMSDECFDTTREIMGEKLKEIINVALIVNSEHQTKTLMPEDVYQTLRILGHNVAQSTELSTSGCAK
jgi:histone H3/H4